MQLLLADNTVNWVIRRYRWLMLAGAALCVLGYLSGGPGLFAGSVLVGTGACGVAFGAWKHERGLWMLACAFLPLLLPSYVLLEYFQLAESPGRATFVEVFKYADFAAGVATLQFQVRWLLTVASHNCRLRGEDSLTRDSHRFSRITRDGYPLE